MNRELFAALRSAMKLPPRHAAGPTALTPSPSFGRFLNNLDARALTSAGVSILILAVIAVLVLFGQELLGLDRDGMRQFLAAVQASPWSFLAVALLFTSLAMVGFPQAVLFAGTVAVFGPWQGSLFAWAATMVSSAATFALGRMFGARWVRKISAGRAQTMIAVMQRRGLLASMIVRWTPSAPFIVINSICGASGMAYWKFAAGTGIGILPKLALIAFFTEQIDEMGRFLASGDPGAMLTLGLLVVAWVAFVLFCRWLYRRLRSSSLAGLASQSGITGNSPVFRVDDEPEINHKSKAP